MSVALLVALCVTSAACYVAAAAVMKVAGGTAFVLVLLPVLVTLGLAARFESLALAGNRFGIVVLLILAAEVLITAGVAVALGERYSLREVAGLVMIVVGIVVVCEADGARHDRQQESAAVGEGPGGLAAAG